MPVVSHHPACVQLLNMVYIKKNKINEFTNVHIFKILLTHVTIPNKQ